MPLFFFVSDLHGSHERYCRLFARVEEERPEAVLLGGDLLPHELGGHPCHEGDCGDFLLDFLARELDQLAVRMGERRPRIMVVLGNDDPRTEERSIEELARRGLLEYVHRRSVEISGRRVFGYSCVPPTPFQLKDWERYDVSRYVDPGCVSPEEGRRTVPVPANEARFRTIQEDLAHLTGSEDMSRSIFLFHAPPYQTLLDRAALDGQFVDHVPLDVHVGSIAIRRFIDRRQPLLTLHGHIHEAARITGAWRDRLGATHLFGAAHDGPELALIRFDPDDLVAATRELI